MDALQAPCKNCSSNQYRKMLGHTSTSGNKPPRTHLQHHQMGNSFAGIYTVLALSQYLHYLLWLTHQDLVSIRASSHAERQEGEAEVLVAVLPCSIQPTWMMEAQVSLWHVNRLLARRRDRQPLPCPIMQNDTLIPQMKKPPARFFF
jgi:hypothetical protein